MQTKLINGLSQIQSKYDAFFIDLWGVVHNGIKLHSEAIEVLENINKLNKRFVLISNAPRPSQNVKNFLTGCRGLLNYTTGLYKILVDRILDAYYGEKEEVDEEGKPVKKGAQQQQQQQGNAFPTPEKLTKKIEPSQVNYNEMHQPTTNPMVNASTPQSAFNPGANELMAANEALGGSFGSMF